MEDSVTSIGDVFIKSSKERVGRFPFRRRQFVRPGRVIGSVDLEVDIDFDTAIKLLNAGGVLVLALPDSTFQDFYIKSVQHLPVRVEVLATGGARETFD